MEFLYKVRESMKFKLFYYFLGLVALFLGNTAFATTVVVQPNTVITTSTTYNNVTLDMSHGSFIVKSNATLTIENSKIKGTLSKNNPILITADIGNLVLKNNDVDIKVVGVTPHPTTQSLYYMMQVALGKADIQNNSFSIDKPFAAGLLITTASIPTTGFKVINNKFERFHGVLYLISSDNAVISNNLFKTNTYGHIVCIGNFNQISNNSIFFAGNDHLGNAIDVIDSSNTSIINNEIYTPTCHGIYIMNSAKLVIDNNKVYGGITYAMNLLSFPETLPGYAKSLLANYKMKHLNSNNITVTNNFMSQNRYGIAASDVDNLVISNNIFIQRFTDAASRKFWTDNHVLLTNVTGLVWTNNLYKEAYSQSISGDNSQSSHFVEFPVTGGVVL